MSDPKDKTGTLTAGRTTLHYGADMRQNFDLYLPAGRSEATTKVSILVHGGGWMNGDKADMNFVIPELNKRFPDWAIANINYRLAGFPARNIFPTQETDMLSFLKYLDAHRKEYHISDQWVFIGASAGAHIAMLAGYKPGSTVKPKAIVNYFGPSDMATLYNSPKGSWIDPTLVRYLFGGITPSHNADLYNESSPLYYINAQSPPTLSFQGTADALVPVAQQTALHAKLSAAGVPNELKLFAGDSHGLSVKSRSESFDLLQAFIAKHTA